MESVFFQLYWYKKVITLKLKFLQILYIFVNNIYFWSSGEKYLNENCSEYSLQKKVKYFFWGSLYPRYREIIIFTSFPIRRSNKVLPTPHNFHSCLKKILSYPKWKVRSNIFKISMDYKNISPYFPTSSLFEWTFHIGSINNSGIKTKFTIFIYTGHLAV